MNLHFDPETDALYIRLDASPIVESEEVQPGVVLDFDADNWVVGIEVRPVTGGVPAVNPRQTRADGAG